MRVELTEAARLVGLPSVAIHQKLTKGILAASTDRQGRRTVDTEDLRRVFGRLQPIHPSSKYQCLCKLCRCAQQTTL